MAIYIIFVPVGVFVWDGMGSLPRELFELPFDKVALISVNRPGFRRHLAAINYGLGGGGYEHE
ncbi:hypothetical protein, partial [Stenotrophomonas maltophilia]|uniref:hypothetical protein n=1 Tax=Stenotrophomonas maltophilia TaxID=40324 RepID=UPI001FA7D9ED